MDRHLQLARLSPRAETALRVAYGLFLLLQLFVTLPLAKRFLVSRAYNGYIESEAFTDAWHTPRNATFVMSAWIAAAAGITFHVLPLVSACVNFGLARYFYLHLRWRSIGRGMGAPGHMNYWFSMLVLLLSLSEFVDYRGIVHALTVLTFRVDFAAIMIAAGIYKITAGYTRGEGFEIGLVNPWWGMLARSARRLNADSWVFRVLNHLAYGIEILCGLAFFYPPAAPFAAFILGSSFLVIGRLIRLTFLTEMIAGAAFLYIFPFDVFDEILTRVGVQPTDIAANASPLVLIVALALAVYLVLLAPAYIGMTLNMYARKRLVPPLQRALDFWTKHCGLILWRVFTLDIINFYVEIFVERDGRREQLAFPGKRHETHGRRFAHVGEFICLASLFTTLKYYPDNTELFSRRLTTYGTFACRVARGYGHFPLHQYR